MTNKGCFDKVPFLRGLSALPVGVSATDGDAGGRTDGRWYLSQDREEVEVTRRRQGSGSGARERAEAPGRRREGQAGESQTERPPVTGGSSGSSGSSGSTGGGGIFGGSGGSSGGFGGNVGGSGGGLGSGGSGAMPSLGGCLPSMGGSGCRGRSGIIILLIVGCLFLAIVGYLLSNGAGGGLMGGETLPSGGVQYEPTAAESTQEFFVTSTPVPVIWPTATPMQPAVGTPAATRPAATGGGSKWLVMLYQDARDQALDQDIFLDLNEAERVGSSQNVQIVSQIDRYRGLRSREWASVKRFHVTRDMDLNRVGSELVQDMGQVNMSDPSTLVDFVTWAVKTYPADKYALIMSDHGMGWPGGWIEPNGRMTRSRNIPLADWIGNMMYLHELDQALTTIRSKTGLDKFEMIGLDACLMSQLEVLSALAPHGRYAVVSEETEPALGWAYTSFLTELQRNPQMTGAELSTLVVKSYISEDQRILDEDARAQLVSRGSTMGGLTGYAIPSADQVARELGRDVTLAAVDLSAVPAVVGSVNNLALAMQQTELKPVAQARSYAQTFTSIFGQQVPPSFVDLGNFAELLTRATKDNNVVAGARDVMAAIDGAVIAEKHGAGKPGATGIAVYFPSSSLYKQPYGGPQSYMPVASRFAQESLWDDFLYYFYTGQGFSPSSNQATAPQRTGAVRAPVAGGIRVSAITASSKTAAPGRPVDLRMDIDGANVGHVKLFAGFYDAAANSINMTDQDYLQSSDTREVGGVYYPVWPASGSFTLKFTWEPIVYAVSNGQQSVVALFTPQVYGASAEQAVYTADGIYTSVDSGESRYARLYFRDGQLRQVLGFQGADFTGAAREIPTKLGDTFTVLDKWIDLDQSGQTSQVVSQRGDTLTFGNDPFVWEELDAAVGTYVVGFLVEDLDGQQTPVFTQVNVQ